MDLDWILGNGPKKPNTEEEQRMKTLKMWLVIGAAVLLTVTIGLTTIYIRGRQSAEEKYQAEIARLEEELARKSDPVSVAAEVSTEVVLSQIDAEMKTIGRLITMEYIYTDVGKFSDPRQLFGHNIPFTTKSIISKWDGNIQAGVDLSAVSLALDEKAKTIRISLPAAEIFAHEIDDTSFETLDEKDGLFNPIKVDDIRTLDSVSKDAMEQRAIENGLLDKANENAKEILSELIGAAVGKDYSIVFA